MAILLEMVAVERELGSGQGDIMISTPNSNHTWSSGISRIVLIFIPKHQVVVY